MRTFLRLFIFLLVFAGTALFNAGIIDIRFEEIRHLLGNIASTDNISNTFGIVAKYELIKRRMQFGEENLTNYEFEAKMQALTSGNVVEENRKDITAKIYRVPVRLLLNGIRILLGKPVINPKEEDKIFSVLEIGYLWERNRKYAEALKIYDEVLATGQILPEIRAAVLVHKAFCFSMLSRYDQSKEIYEQVINLYPNTEAGILSWKLLDFITSMEKERATVQKARLSGMEKAKQFYLLMDFRNAIKNYSKFLTADQKLAVAAEARFFKGRSHEELGEVEEAMMEYRAVIKRDPTKKWARQANRRMLMLGEFYEQKKTVSEEAKRQLEAYQDQVFIQNVEKYSSMVSKSSLKKELAGQTEEGKKTESMNDSIMALINQIGNLDLTGNDVKDREKKKKLDEMHRELIEKGTLSAAEIRELQRRQYLADNPFRRPSALKQYIDANSRELRYLYNKRLRSGIKLSGKMLMEIKIKADGTIGSVKVLQSDMGDEEFERQIAAQINKWKFKAVPDSLGKLTVNYPFEFYEEQ
ncbi:MAG: TonB family protein [Chitinispirillaceae bacterium]|nr:TonB family protein [Chitinispirillaceae bacterium]